MQRRKHVKQLLVCKAFVWQMCSPVDLIEHAHDARAAIAQEPGVDAEVQVDDHIWLLLRRCLLRVGALSTQELDHLLRELAQLLEPGHVLGVLQQ